jgi:hypothetical protein
MNTSPLPKLLESKAYRRAVTAWDGPWITIIPPANKGISDESQAVNSVDPPFARTFVCSSQGKKAPFCPAYAYVEDIVFDTPHDLRSKLCELLFWTFLYYALQTSRGRWQSKQSPLLRDNSECSSKFLRP